MLDRYDFSFKGITASKMEILIQTRPNMPGIERRVTFQKIPGKEMSVAFPEKERDNIPIHVQCGFRVQEWEWNKKMREIRRWLYGSGDLMFSDNQDVFYKARNVLIKEFKRPMRRQCTFTAEFICEPAEYITAGKEKYEQEEVMNNRYDTCHPIYIVKKEKNIVSKGGISINGKTVKFEMAENQCDLYIDTEKMIAYTQAESAQTADFITEAGMHANFANETITGKYEDLYLLAGTNAFGLVMDSGIKPDTLRVIPNWRYER